MYDGITESMFEFAMTVQTLIGKGWRLEEIEYGEQRLNIGPRLIIKRGEETKTIYRSFDLGRVAEDV